MGNHYTDIWSNSQQWAMLAWELGQPLSRFVLEMWLWMMDGKIQHFSWGWMMRRSLSRRMLQRKRTTSSKHEDGYSESGTIHRRCKMEVPQTPVYRWVDKLWHVCTAEYYSAFERKGELLDATTWVNFETIGFNRRSQPQRVTDYIIPIVWNTQSTKIYTGGK